MFIRIEIIIFIDNAYQLQTGLFQLFVLADTEIVNHIVEYQNEPHIPTKLFIQIEGYDN